MISRTLAKMERQLNDVIAGTNPKISIKLPFVTIEIDLSALRSLKLNRSDLAITIDQCFMRKRLYVASLDMETIDLTLESATEIRETLDQRVKDLSGLGGDNRVALELMLAWGACAKRLEDVLRSRKLTQSAAQWIKDDPSSADALMRFRTDSLPIIGILIGLLEGLTKNRAEENFENATKLLAAPQIMAISNAVSA